LQTDALVNYLKEFLLIYQISCELDLNLPFNIGSIKSIYAYVLCNNPKKNDFNYSNSIDPSFSHNSETILTLPTEIKLGNSFKFM